MVLTRIIVFILLRLQMQGGPEVVNGSPAFSSDRMQLNYTLIEEQSAGIVLGNVKDAFLRSKNYNQETLSRLGFYFLRSEGHHLEYFEIEEDNGILKTKDVLDRELPCGSSSNAECELEFEVAIRPVPVTYLEVVIVTVHIKDINDNQPRFLKDVHSVNVSETALPGATFILPMAQDLDSKAFSIQNYLLANPPLEFALQVSSNDGLPSDVRLALRKKLDRELEPTYNMHLVAVDGGVPPLSGTLTVNVQVLDANDNSPVFDEDSYSGRVREDAEVGAVVLQVHATDSDEGSSGSVMFSLVTDGGLPQNLPFSVGEESGEILVSGPLDFEDKNSYTLTVSAKDRGPSAVPTSTRVVINIIDVNDHAPRIIVNSLTSSGRVEVPENAEQGQFVAHLTVEDIDAGQNGLVTCKTENQHFDVEQMYTNEYKVISKEPCDRETSAVVQVMITCSDNAEENPLKSETEVEIYVLDQNDKAPQFTLPLYSVTVQENNAVGIPLLTVNATDQDIGQNAEISYEVDEDAQGMISVDSKTGLLRTNAVFDHEKLTNLEFHVVAFDGGSPILSSSATVVLNVLDANDAYPVFPKQIYNFATFENQPVGTEIGTVSANDADDPPYNTVLYTMQAPQDIADAFKVESNTGKIVAKKVLDRETRPMYTMTIMASNPGTTHQSASTSVTIYVADVNDNPPIFTFPNPENASVIIPSNAPPGFLVTRLEAIDADFSQNSKLFFSVVEDDWGIFVVDSHTGIVSIGKHWKHLDGDYFTIKVSVTDRGDTPLSSTTDLHIVVNKTLNGMVSSGKLQQSSPVITGSQLILLLSAISLLLIIVLVIAVVVVKRQLYNRKREERRRYAYRVDLTPTPSATLPDIQFTEANDSGSDPANNEFTPIDNFHNERALSSAAAGAAAGGTDLHNLSHDASPSQQSSDDSKDYGAWDRQMVTEVAIEPQTETKCSVPTPFPNQKCNQQPTTNDKYYLDPSPSQFPNQNITGHNPYASSVAVSMGQGSGIRPQLIDTSALLHHLNWLQNNPNAQMVPMVQLQPCSESCEDTESSTSASSSSSSSCSDKAESSTSSVCSAELSISDSGKGTSEDDCHALALAALNSKPFNGTTYQQLHVPVKSNHHRPSYRKCSRAGPQKPSGGTPAMYTSLQPVQPSHPKQNYCMNVPQYMPVAPPREQRGSSKRQNNPKHQQNCPCCKVKLLSTIHGQPCGSNARPYSPDANSRPTSPENVNILSGVNNNRSRPVTPVSVVNNNRSHSPSNPIDPNKASVHSHPNCKCDVGSAKKVDNAQTQQNSPKRRAPTPPTRKPSTKLCSTERINSLPVGPAAVNLKNNLTSECVV